MILELDPNKYQAIAKILFDRAIDASGIDSQTGSLKNSLEVTREQDGNGYKFVISFNEYGIFLDQGVKGVKTSSKAPNSPFGYKASNKGIFNVPGLALSMKQRGAIYWYGIKPYPWVENFLASLGEALNKEITDEMVENITSSPFFQNGEIVLTAKL